MCHLHGCSSSSGLRLLSISPVSSSLDDALSSGRAVPRNLVPQGLERFTQGPLPGQLDVERISPAVTCVLGQNASNFTLNGTNIYLVGTGKRRILIDAGEKSFRTAKVISLLEQVFAEQGVDGLDEIVCTHLHHDHVGGAREIAARFGCGRISKYPSPASEIDRRWGMVREEQLAAGVTDASVIPPGAKLVYEGLEFERIGYEKLSEGDLIQTEGASLRVLHTPGHATDHIVLLLEQEQAVFTGDHVLGWGTSWVEDLGDYVSSLNKIAALRPLRLYPGHGPFVREALPCLHRYMRHRHERELQVVHYLQSSGSGGEVAVEAQSVVDELYPNTKDPRALGNVVKILVKLEREGVVAVRDAGWALL